MTDELAAKRFERAATADESAMSDMLNKVLLDLAGGESFDHMMILCSRRCDGSTFFRRYQAGDFSYVERLGLLENAKMDEWKQG